MQVAFAVAAAVAVLAAFIAFRTFKSLKAAQERFAAESARLNAEITRRDEELRSAAESRSSLETERHSLEETLAEAQKTIQNQSEQVQELESQVSQLKSQAEQALFDQKSQQRFFGRKARDTVEVVRQRLAAEGFPERIDDIANGSPKPLSEETKRLVKEIESWMAQGGSDDPDVLHLLGVLDFARGDAKHAELRLRAASRVSDLSLIHISEPTRPY